jgi:Ca-activated chloride channel family protein
MVSIVTYAGSAGLVLGATDVADSADIAAAINNLEAGGSTAGSAGIDLAYEQAQEGFIQGGINHVILCTDGDFNVGPYSTTELLDQIEQERLSGVTLAVLGIGTYVNDSMMETISNAGNGVYGVINSNEDADRYVEEEMLASINFVAKDVKIQVEFNPSTVLAYRLLGYENRAIADEDFRDDTVDAGEVGSGHQVTALYELVMADGQLPQCAQEVDDGEPVEGEREIGLEEVVLVKVRYKDLGATEQDPAVEVRESLLNGLVLTRLADADGDLQWAAAVAGFAEILRGSPCAASDNLDDIEGIISAENWLDDARSEFVELFGMAVDLLAP